MAIIDEIKSAATLVHQIGNMDLYKKILEIQAQAMDLMENNLRFQKENQMLKEKLEISGKLVCEKDVYWFPMDGKKDGPFCTRCWDADKKLVRLHKLTGNPVYSKCPNCAANPIKLNPEMERGNSFAHEDYDPLA